MLVVPNQTWTKGTAHQHRVTYWGSEGGGEDGEPEIKRNRDRQKDAKREHDQLIHNRKAPAKQLQN